jgi:transposase
MKRPKIHLEIQSRGDNHYGIFRSSFRDGDKVRHLTHGRVQGLDLPVLRSLQACLREELVPKNSPEALQIKDSKEFGASSALLGLAKSIGLDQLLYSRSEPWVKNALALIVGRIVYSGSKLALSQVSAHSELWELCGVDGPIDVDEHCYQTMDRLLERQPAIQRALAQKHLTDGHLVLYDLTSSYFEGKYENSDLVTFGYNRDGKKGHEQVVIGLICAPDGCPIGTEVFAGNTKDSTTFLDQVKRVRDEYGLKQMIWVGDRGTVTQANADQIQTEGQLHTIGALTHPEMVSLLSRGVIQLELFDEKKVVEVIDPKEPTQRYCLCRNPATASRETQTRLRLLDRTRAGLEKIAQSQRSSKPEATGARVGRLLERYKMGKFVTWEIKEGKLEWQFDESAIAAEKAFDGCYIIRADVPKEKMKETELVGTYKQLSLVEQAFRNLKTVSLEMRPMYHKKDDRIRSHVFICMLAYHLQWHMVQRLKPLFASDGQGEDRKWTVQNVLESLKAVRRERVTLGKVEVKLVTEVNEDQRRIMELLKKGK